MAIPRALSESASTAIVAARSAAATARSVTPSRPVVLVEPRHLHTQFLSWRHAGSIDSEQVVMAGHDLPDHAETLGNRPAVRGELPRPPDQQLDVNVQDPRYVKQHGQPIRPARAT